MKFKSFEIGDTCKYWQPTKTGYNCMDVRTGTVKSIRMGIIGSKEYGIETVEGNTIYIDTSTVSAANGGHHCELGPCEWGDYGKCVNLAKCRSCQ